MYNMPLPQKRMKDEELILRFLGLFFDFEKYYKPMNSFLSNFMANNRNASDKVLGDAKAVFSDTISFIEKNRTSGI